jgi:hypothetical protein
MSFIYGKYIVMIWLFLKFDKDTSDNKYTNH